MKLILPIRENRIGIDKSFNDSIILDALNDLSLFNIEVDFRKESVVEKWLSEYKNNHFFRIYTDRLTEKMRLENKKKAISICVKENKRTTLPKGGDWRKHWEPNGEIYCLSTFYKKRRKKIRKKIIREGLWKRIKRK